MVESEKPHTQNKPEINGEGMKLFNYQPLFKYNKALVYFYKIDTYI